VHTLLKLHACVHKYTVLPAKHTVWHKDRPQAIVGKPYSTLKIFYMHYSINGSKYIIHVTNAQISTWASCDGYLHKAHHQYYRHLSLKLVCKALYEHGTEKETYK